MPQANALDLINAKIKQTEKERAQHQAALLRTEGALIILRELRRELEDT